MTEHQTPVVLCADDEPGLLRLLRTTVASTREFTFVEAGDGDEAWRLIQEHRPAVALLDVLMPGRTGIELTRAIKADPDLAGTYVILLTANRLPSDEAAGLAAGADLYLTKPFKPGDVLAAIGWALHLRPTEQ